MACVRNVAVWVAACVLSANAFAQGDAADTATARAYFEEGTAHYDRHDYARALASFEQARRLVPLPALDYDIGRCYERLGRPNEALAAYQRYVENSTTADNLDQVRASIAALTVRAPRRTFLAPGLVAGGALVLTAVAAGLIGSVGPALDDLTTKWNAAPSVALQDDAHALQDRAIASYVLFGVAGAVAVVDLALWVRAARRARR